jgi:hypothetical protein
MDATTARAVKMAAALAQQHGAAERPQEAGHGDRDCFAMGDRSGSQDTTYAFDANRQRDRQQREHAGEGGEFAELSGAEGEARTVRAAVRVKIREGRDAERRGVRAHVPCVPMCQLSASKAIEPNSVPHAISTTIMTSVRAITMCVRRSLRP